jgi:hypothetical protein
LSAIARLCEPTVHLLRYIWARGESSWTVLLVYTDIYCVSLCRHYFACASCVCHARPAERWNIVVQACTLSGCKLDSCLTHQAELITLRLGSRGTAATASVGCWWSLALPAGTSYRHCTTGTVHLTAVTAVLQL